MRLFVAVEIPAEVRQRLSSLIRELRAVAAHVKWVRAENLHLTLKFIGETESAKVDAIRAALARIGRRGSIELQFQGLGFFPNEKRPRVFWAGLEAPQELPQLASDIDVALASVGFPREQRQFTPHLTLARLDGMRLTGPLLDTVSKRASEEFGAARVTEFHLIESKLKSTGAEYTAVQSFPIVLEK